VKSRTATAPLRRVGALRKPGRLAKPCALGAPYIASQLQMRCKVPHVGLCASARVCFAKREDLKFRKYLYPRAPRCIR
jgi:hypothetical protein